MELSRLFQRPKLSDTQIPPTSIAPSSPASWTNKLFWGAGFGRHWFLGWCFFLFAVSLVPAAEPPNDRFTKFQRISGFSGTVTGSNLGATKQAGEPVHAGVGGGHSVWYRWTAPFSVNATFNTVGSAFDTVLAAYTGSALNNLTEIASNNNSVLGQVTSEINFRAVEGTDYILVIDSVADDQGDLVLNWNTVPANDLFKDFQLLDEFVGTLSGDTTGATLEPGEAAALAAMGDDIGGTVWFAWPATVSGQVTFSTLGSGFDTVLGVYTGNDFGALSLVTWDDNGGGPDGTSSVTWNAESGARYRIVVAGRGGVQGPFSLNWEQVFPPPANDAFLAARALSGFTGQTSGDNLGATVEPSEPPHADGASQASVWFSWTASREGTVKFVTDRSLFPTDLAVYTGDALENLKLVARSQDQGAGLAGSVAFTTLENQQYWIALDGQGGAKGLYLLQWTYSDLTTPNNDFADATVISGSLGKVVGENYYADREPGEPFHAGDAGGRSVWYAWTAPLSYRVVFETLGSNFDTLLAVYTGVNPVLGLTQIQANDDANGRLTSRVAFDAVGGKTYWIAVDGSTDRGIKSAPIGMVVLTWSPSSADFIGLVPAQGMIGSQVRVYGPDLGSVTSVVLGGIEAEFSYEEERLTVTVPSGAASGPVLLNGADGSVRTADQSFVLLPGSPPQISIRWKEPGVVRIAWSSQYPEFTLEWSYLLSASAVWQPGGVPTQQGGEYVVEQSVDLTRLSCYYRLVLR